MKFQTKSPSTYPFNSFNWFKVLKLEKYYLSFFWIKLFEIIDQYTILDITKYQGIILVEETGYRMFLESDAFADWVVCWVDFIENVSINYAEDVALLAYSHHMNWSWCFIKGNIFTICNIPCSDRCIMRTTHQYIFLWYNT